MDLPYILQGKYFKETERIDPIIKAECVTCKEAGILNVISCRTNATTNFLTHLKACLKIELSRHSLTIIF